MSFEGDLTRLLLAAWDESRRQAARRRRETERWEKWQAKQRAFEAATLEVEEYEEHVNRLLSIHKTCGEYRSWKAIQGSDPPKEPVRTCPHEELAQRVLERYRPNLFDKLLRRTDSKRRELTAAVDSARQADEDSFQREITAYEEAYAEWKLQCETAARVLEGDQTAWLKVVGKANPFADINELGGSVELLIRDGRPDVTVTLVTDGIVPTDVKTVLKSGKLSVKKMGQTRFFELYRSYVSGCVIRIARELFALLPVKAVVVTAIGTAWNEDVGPELRPIISASIRRGILEDVLSRYPGPVACLMSFIPRMNFRKTKGFVPIEPFGPKQISHHSDPI